MLLSNFNTINTIVKALLFTIGLWKLFPKFKINKVWALFPFGRLYKLAQCADREEDGLSYMLFSALLFIVNILYNQMLPYQAELHKAILILQVISLILAVMIMVYHIRLFSGLCHVFDKKGWWIVCWILFESITSVIWGFSRNFQPVNSEILSSPELSRKNESSSDEGLVVDITKRIAGPLFHRRALLRDIHFTIEPGNMVLLLGGSGSGKTTLVNALTGYEKASAKITLNGSNVYKEFDSMKYKIGFVPQQETVRLNDTISSTIIDNALLRLPGSVSSNELHKRVDAVIEAFGLTPARRNLVAKQSGGMKKRISIAMEYVSDPELFVLDEPDSGLDGIMAKALMERLHAISREGKIVIVITHTPDRVIDLFDKVLVLARDSARTGRLAFYGDVSKAREFFGTDSMEQIVRIINRKDEGGEGRADEMIEKYEEVRK